MTVLQTLILALVQGFTEFLPVSSSGHLVLTEQLLGIHNNDIMMEVFMHFGTFLSVLIIFRKDILQILKGFFSGLAGLARRSGEKSANADFRMSLYIIASMIPAGVAGVLFKDFFESLFKNPAAVSASLIVTGLILYFTRFVRKSDKRLSLANTFIIGLAQALAIVPGISRSGTTISTALFQGIDKEQAARFSFIMALPVVLGATLLEALDADWSTLHILPVILGTVVAFLAGYAAIKWLLGILVRGRFHVFAYYCVAIGLISLGFFML